MQIESLKIFCDLVEAKSFTKAAKINGVTQSAVSQQISAMETQYHSLLIQRSKKRDFILTREGHLVYGYGKQILSSFNSIAISIQQVRDVGSRNIDVASILSIGLYNLPSLLLTFTNAYPKITVRVTYHHAQKVYEDVDGNVVDLGLVAYPHPQNHIEVVSLGSEPLVLISAPNHSFANGGTLKLQDLQGQNFIHFAPDLPTRRAIERLFTSAKVKVRTVLELDNIDILKRAVEIESGLAIVPQPTIAQEVIKKTLVAVQIDAEGLSRPIAAIHRKGQVLSPALKAFLAVLKEGASKLV